jgi:tetratricopeptide (TPR) repeat protein
MKYLMRVPKVPKVPNVPNVPNVPYDVGSANNQLSIDEREEWLRTVIATWSNKADPRYAEADPRYAEAHCNLGHLLLNERQDVDGAEKAYLAAIQADPEHVKAKNELKYVQEMKAFGSYRSRPA